MPDPLAPLEISLLALYGLGMFVVLLTATAYYLGYRLGDTSDGGPVADGGAGETVTFADVCNAVARAKTDRQRQAHLSQEYVSGADEVLLELMVEHDLSVGAQRMAVLAGGMEVELETDAGSPLARSADDFPQYHPPDGPGDGVGDAAGNGGDQS